MANYHWQQNDVTSKNLYLDDTDLLEIELGYVRFTTACPHPNVGPHALCQSFEKARGVQA